MSCIVLKTACEAALHMDHSFHEGGGGGLLCFKFPKRSGAAASADTTTLHARNSNHHTITRHRDFAEPAKCLTIPTCLIRDSDGSVRRMPRSDSHPGAGGGGKKQIEGGEQIFVRIILKRK